MTNVEPAHVTAAADGGRPEIKSDMGSLIILAQSRSGSREGATPGAASGLWYLIHWLKPVRIP